jgi:ribosomal protein L36
VTESRTVQTERPCKGAMPPIITCEGGYAGGAASSSLSSPHFCTKCNGTGRAIYDDEQYYSVTCHGCRGRRHVVCPTCNGAGRVQCSTCNGSGHVQCEKCRGNGTILTYLTVKVQFEPSKDDCEIQPSSKAEEKLSDQDFDDLFLSSSKRYGLEFAKQMSPEKVQDAVTLCLGRCHSQEHADKRIVRQEILVRRATVVKVICESEAKTFKIWLVGKYRLVQSENDPVSSWLKEQIENSVGLWESGDKDEAVKVARRCWYMSQSHGNCKRIFSSAKIPVELRDMADDKKQSEAAGCGWLFGGCLSVFLVLIAVGGIGVMYDEGANVGQVVFSIVCAALSVLSIRYTRTKWREEKEIDERLKQVGPE